MSSIKPITMPKWGLAMEEGVLSRWSVEEGANISAGQEIMDIETTKIANVFESPVAGTLRRRIVAEGETVPVGALLGVVSEPGVPDAEVDAYVQKFLEDFRPPEKGASDAVAPQTIDANGRRIRYLAARPADGSNAGPPLLLIHGFGADYTTWMFNQGDLAADRPVYAIDLPGHGGSVKDVGDGAPASLAKTVLDFMDAAGIARAHLVGHSLGGAIAVEIALAYPDRVTALTLISPAGFGPEISQDFIEGFIAESRARKLKPVLELLVADPKMVTGDMVEEVLKFKRLDGAIPALRTIAAANFSNGMQTLSLRGRLAEIRAPIQVIWGEADQILPASHADNLSADIAVTHIPGAGHIAHMEKAAEVTSIIIGNG